MSVNSDSLEIRREGRVLRIALDRPDKRNALNFALCRSLADQVDEAGKDPDVGAILLVGNGPAFCAGMDLDEMLMPEANMLSHVHERLFTIGSRAIKPIVAAVHGPALAGGMGLAANAHILVAEEGAVFGLPEIHLALWPFLVFRQIAAAVGERRAVELSLTGRRISAQEAKDLGLVHFLTPAGGHESKAMEIARDVASRSTTAARAGLLCVAECRDRTFEEAGHIAFRYREELFRSEEFLAAVRSFQEKRNRKPTI